MKKNWKTFLKESSILRVPRDLKNTRNELYINFDCEKQRKNALLNVPIDGVRIVFSKCCSSKYWGDNHF